MPESHEGICLWLSRAADNQERGKQTIVAQESYGGYGFRTKLLFRGHIIRLDLCLIAAAEQEVAGGH
jgi:hypothetical protein